MKKIICITCFFLSLTGHGQTLTVAQLRADFDTLRSALEEAHGGLYRHYSKTTIDERFIQYRKKLDSPKTQWDFYGFLSKLLASLGDGHMKLEYDESAPKPSFLPFRILTDKKKAIIFSNDTKDDGIIRPGMFLQRINGRSYESIREMILPHLISGDGYNETKKSASLERNFSQYYWLFVDTASIFIIQVKDSSGKEFTVRVNGLSNKEREANRNNNPVNARVAALTGPLEGSSDNISLRFINDSLGYLKIRYLIGDRFDKEIDSVLSLVRNQNIRSLVLDIRGNGGGLDEWGAFLVSRFTSKPFRYMNKIQTRVLVPSFADWKQKPPVDLVKGAEPSSNGGYLIKPLLNRTLLEQAPADLPYTGKLIVLIDGRTFSAASDFCAVLRTNTNATFVGVETGGGYEGNTSALNAILKLPHSKFKVNIHLWDIWTAVKPLTLKGRGVLPDYPVERNAADWLKGIDTQLEAAMKLAGKHP